jgi:hypothetical protein
MSTRPLGMPPPVTPWRAERCGRAPRLAREIRADRQRHGFLSPVELGLPDRLTLEASSSGKLTHGFLRSFDASFLSLMAIEIKVATGTMVEACLPFRSA